MQSTIDEIKLLIRSRYPIIYLLTYEEGRAERILKKIASDLDKTVEPWSVTIDSAHIPPEKKALAALDSALSKADPSIFIMRDFHPFIGNETVTRKLRDIAREFARSFKTLIILSPTLKIPPELEKDIAIIDLPLPGREEVRDILEEALSFVDKHPQLASSITDEGKNAMIDATLGLTLNEGRRIFSKAMLTDHMFDEEDIDLILFEKKQLIRKSGSLEYFDFDEEISSVGGMNSLKKWLNARRESYTTKARKFGLPMPKGLLLLGVQGCGKSLTSKAVASLWRQPLLRLDMGRIFSSFIGSSEENMRKAIATAESLAPVILWIDEIEKGFSGIKSSGSTDAGVTSRLFGTFITWMQEKTKAVFVIATANSISDLPPELLRKGRFDEIFFIDLPKSDERQEIFNIHIAKRKRDPRKYNLAELAKASEGFSGAEIEMAVVEGMYGGFAARRDFNTDDIVTAIKSTVPLSRTMAEEIESLRNWAKYRARMASE